MLGDSRETADLVVLREQAEERVERDEDQREPSGDRHVGEVTHRHRYALATGLRPELADHRRRRVDPVDREAPVHERQGEATGPDPELQERPRTRDGRQKLHGALGVRGQARQVVVHVGDALAVGRHIVRPRGVRPAGLRALSHGRLPLAGYGKSR